MAMGVEAVTLTPKPIERITEYVATVKSRRSTTIQPQVEGFITRIRRRPGQRVARGAVLMRDRLQAAAGGRRQPGVAARGASGGCAVGPAAGRPREDAARCRRGQPAGVRPGGHRRADRRRRRCKAVEEQIRQQRVELGYYRVTAPTAGVVGDIPVRVGDRVTPLDDADDRRPERRPRDLHQRPGGAGDRASKPACRCASSTIRRGDRRRPTRSNFISPSVDDRRRRRCW